MPRSRVTARASHRTAGTKCKHCDMAIEKFKVKRNGLRGEIDTFVHSGTSNVWCQTELVGLTAKFAEPG